MVLVQCLFLHFRFILVIPTVRIMLAARVILRPAATLILLGILLIITARVMPRTAGNSTLQNYTVMATATAATAGTVKPAILLGMVVHAISAARVMLRSAAATEKKASTGTVATVLVPAGCNQSSLVARCRAFSNQVSLATTLGHTTARVILRPAAASKTWALVMAIMAGYTVLPVVMAVLAIPVGNAISMAMLFRALVRILLSQLQMVSPVTCNHGVVGIRADRDMLPPATPITRLGPSGDVWSESGPISTGSLL